MLTIGLVVNPVAGVGGPAGLKGSDGVEIQAQARGRGAEPQAHRRAHAAFAALEHVLNNNPAERAMPVCRVIAPLGAMGLDAVAGTVFGRTEDTPLPESAGSEHAKSSMSSRGLSVLVEALPGFDSIGAEGATSAADTRAVVAALLPQIDLLVFVGGDGTARDVLDAIRDSDHEVPVLGIPAGVKMHSGVFATSPHSAGLLLGNLLDGGLVAATHAEVKDIDEAALRRGEVGSRRYGELLVPAGGGYLQHVKSGGKEVEALVLLEIAAEVGEHLVEIENSTPLVLGPGSTCFAIKEQLLQADESDQSPTLLGVDVVHAGELLMADATANDLVTLIAQYPGLQVVLSYSRSQGFVLGRGNQQLSPEFLAALPAAALHVASSRTKLLSLEGRPLLVDTGVAALDEKFSGLTQIISGYEDKLLYLVQPA